MLLSSPSSSRPCANGAKIIFAFLLVLAPIIAPAAATITASISIGSSIDQAVSSPISDDSIHPRDFRVQRKKRQNQTSRAALIYYSSLIAFGDSYTDNAHTRAAWLNNTFQSHYVASGGRRSSNGPVEVEHMVSATITPQLSQRSTPVALYDYALGGTQIDNSLSYSPFPGAKDQIEQYLSELSKGNVSLGTDRVLHFYFSGINPMWQIFSELLNSGLTDVARTKAQSRVSANTNGIKNQLQALASDSRLTSRTKRADYLLMSLPALWYNPLFWQRAWGGNPTAVAALTELTNQFNAELKAITTNLAPIVASRGGKVFFGDLSALWVSMSEQPTKYGFTIPWIFDPCWKGDSNPLCSNPERYLMWDTLHATERAHYHIAVAMNKLVRGL